MLWIKDVEKVDSVHDLKWSCSIQGYTNFPKFEMPDAKIASALNMIIQISYFKKRSVWRNVMISDLLSMKLTWPKIALSCPFALDALCYKEGVHDSA